MNCFRKAFSDFNNYLNDMNLFLSSEISMRISNHLLLYCVLVQTMYCYCMRRFASKQPNTTSIDHGRARLIKSNGWTILSINEKNTLLPSWEYILLWVIHDYYNRRQLKGMHIQWCWKKYMWLCNAKTIWGKTLCTLSVWIYLFVRHVYECKNENS